MRAEWYILEGHKPVPCFDIETWSQHQKISERIVAKTKKGEVEVSTVFLGMDHGWGEGKPVLFETMVFGGEHDQDMQRYTTWENAEEGHKEMCKSVFGDES